MALRLGGLHRDKHPRSKGAAIAVGSVSTGPGTTISPSSVRSTSEEWAVRPQTTTPSPPQTGRRRSSVPMAPGRPVQLQEMQSCRRPSSSFSSALRGQRSPSTVARKSGGRQAGTRQRGKATPSPTEASNARRRIWFRTSRRASQAEIATGAGLLHAAERQVGVNQGMTVDLGDTLGQVAARRWRSGQIDWPGSQL